ncbi:MAG: SlyX family protein [Rhizobacter sp.]|nr:SlyX family protein [Bacteriovorax sp.]
MIEERLTALEIKFSHQDFLVDELNKMVSDQQQLIDKLIKEIQNLKISMDGNAQSARTLEDDVPPHY